MAVLVLDPEFEARIKVERGDNGRDEVWDGVLVMSPIADLEHQDIGAELAFILRTVLATRQAGRIFAGVNVSDRAEGWTENYRIPDVALYLRGNPARDAGTHYVGGPDLAIEIASRFDRSRDKAAFYAAVGVREFLVIDRDPWAIELYRPEGGTMTLVARSTVEAPGPIRLGILPLSIGLVAGEARPSIAVAHEADGRAWSI